MLQFSVFSLLWNLKTGSWWVMGKWIRKERGKFSILFLVFFTPPSLGLVIATKLFTSFFFLFWLNWVFIYACSLSLVVTSRSYSLVEVCKFLIVVASLVAVAHSLVALQHVGYSQTSDQIHVPCIGERILNRWTTREVLCSPFFNM